ncbi:MAG: polysaccharide pyruvyl transferase family protein [Candidatus Omnitrophica bacterium]|nr:polysaccharide pyruvyl transferase family protein [Candidatus Omnitrophota bacterium]
MKIYIFNDTMNIVHSGSDAVMRSIYDKLRGHEILGIHKVNEFRYDVGLFKDCDAVLVNGEGTIHHRSNAGNFLMATLRTAQQMNKKTFLINALFQEKAPYYNDVLEKLNYFSVRDIISLENARKCRGKPKLFLDLCADPMFRNSGVAKFEEEIVIGGAHWDTRKFSFPKMISMKKLLLRFPYPKLYLDLPFEDVIATLKKCKLYVTGQHHGLYAAGLAGIPVVPLISNSNKIESLIEWSKLPIKICSTKRQIERSIKWSLSNPTVFKEFQEFLFSQPVMGKSEVNYMLSQ